MTIDTELDILFKQSNAAPIKQVDSEIILNQLKKVVEPVNEVSADSENQTSTTTSSDHAPIDPDHITRKQRKEMRSDSSEKSDRTLFLGNLPISTATDKKLQKLLKQKFSVYGPVESIRFRSIPFAEPQARRVAFIKKNFRTKKDGTYSGTCNGYVVMCTKQAALDALKENATIFAERHLRVDLASDGEGGSKTITKKSVFIGNLSMDLEEEPVWQLFGKCGSVTNVRLVRDRVTNMGKGIGYVTFASKDSVDLALKIQGTMLNNRPVRVSRCCKLGMVEKKKDRAGKLADLRAKKSAALVKSNPQPQHLTTDNLGAAKKVTSHEHGQDEEEVTAKKVSKKEAKLQAELKTKFGQLFHKKFPFSKAISDVSEEKDKVQSKSKSKSINIKGKEEGKKSSSSKSASSASTVKSAAKHNNAFDYKKKTEGKGKTEKSYEKNDKATKISFDGAKVSKHNNKKKPQ